jgi:aryl-alcohol dehydrogenase-like predicted oxidoreductase
MEYKTLGNTGLLVSTLCLGCMTFHGGEGFWKKVGTVDQAGADELVKSSIDAGINFFDTADVYSEGESEKTLGQSLKNLKIARKDVVIATKVYGRTGPGRNDVGASRGHIMDAVDASLRRLQTDHIDLYQIHGNDTITPIEETLRALDTLVQQGKVRYIGVSNWLSWKIAKALTISDFRNLARFDTLQAYYSIAGRDLERDLVPAAGGREDGAAGLESACRWAAVGQVQPREPEAGRDAALRVRFSDRRQGTHLEDTRRDQADSRGARLLGSTRLACVVVEQAIRDFGHHRRQTAGPARRQPCRRRSQAVGRGVEEARRSKRAAAGVPGLDASVPGRGETEACASAGVGQRTRSFFKSELCRGT